MATKKKVEPTLQDERNNFARMCGVMSGTCDHIARLQAELLDIAGRCTLAMEFGDPIQAFTAKDEADMLDLQKFCRERFDHLADARMSVQSILKRISSR